MNRRLLFFTLILAIFTLVSPELEARKDWEGRSGAALKLSKYPDFEKSEKKNPDDIELIEGTPNRPFKKIAPIWESGHSLWGLRPNMEKTLQKVRKKAAKMGADAIIEFRIGTGNATVGTGYGFGHGSFGANGSSASGSMAGMSGWGTTTNPAPVIQGWAVEWVDEAIVQENGPTDLQILKVD